MLKKVILTLALFTLPALTMAQSLVPANTSASDGGGANQDNMHGRRLWIASLCAVAAASAFDAASSWGKLEGNPILASHDGTFGGRGVSLKAGLVGVLVVRQFTMRHNTAWRSRFTIANFGAAAMYAGVAARNTQIAAPTR